jgi:Tfp pilus assembly protein PilP
MSVFLLAAAIAGGPAVEGGYAYDAAGRRDPFRNPRTVNTHIAVDYGPPAIDEVVLRGIVKTRDGYVAMLVGPRGQTFTVRAGHHLWDGAIETIDAGGVTFRQEVRDPLSPVKSRMVRKTL